MTRLLPGRSFCLLTAAFCALSAGAQSPPALNALLHGRADEAIHLAQASLSANPGDGHAHLLLCRAAYAEEQTETAVNECTRASSLLPHSSEAAMWQGRALGQQAAHTNPLSAYKLAGRVRTTFEHAHELNPTDDQAAADLADFYIQAPGIVGGSPEKAQALAQGMLARSPAQAHRLLAMIAEDRHDNSAAEAEFRKQIAIDPAVGNIDLANFYQRQKQYDQAQTAITQALAADHMHGPVLMDAATLLTTLKRQPDVAERALRTYIASTNQTDEAPVFKAHLLLGRMLAHRGDKSGARAEYTAALALASDYAPARKAMDAL